MNKSGAMTSEFWVTIATLAAAVVTTIYGLSPTDAAAIHDAAVKAVVSVGSLISAAAVAWKYIHARNELKAVAHVAAIQSQEEPDAADKGSYGFHPVEPK